MKTFYLLALLAVSAVAQTARIPYPFEGEWILDVQESNFGGLPAPREGSVTFTMIDFGAIEYYTCPAKGDPRSAWHIFNPDGKEYTIENSGQWDKTVLQKADESYTTFEATYTNKGRFVGVRRFVIIGGTLTVRTTLWATATQGEMIVALVYRKKE